MQEYLKDFQMVFVNMLTDDGTYVCMYVKVDCQWIRRVQRWSSLISLSYSCSKPILPLLFSSLPHPFPPLQL